MVGSIGGFNAAAFAATSGLTRSTAAKASTELPDTITSPNAKDVFRDYMKMTPAERMAENWLKSHGLSKEKLKAMSPEEREATLKQMKQEIEDQLKQQANQKGQVVDLTA